MRVAACNMRLAHCPLVPSQRVKSASVTVEGTLVSQISRGVLALVGIYKDDNAADLEYCAKKLCASKLWDNENQKSWRKSVKQMEYEVLLVSQFTLFGDISHKKHVPDFSKSMKSAHASARYGEFKSIVAAQYGDPTKVKDGVFGAMMDVTLVNDGPVTLLVDSRESIPDGVCAER